jgi:hypothetical protein
MKVMKEGIYRGRILLTFCFGDHVYFETPVYDDTQMEGFETGRPLYSTIDRYILICFEKGYKLKEYAIMGGRVLKPLSLTLCWLYHTNQRHYSTRGRHRMQLQHQIVNETMIPIMNLQVRGSEMKLEELLMQTIPTLSRGAVRTSIIEEFASFPFSPGKRLTEKLLFRQSKGSWKVMGGN